jgi:predicted nucleic acid-binding protein
MSVVPRRAVADTSVFVARESGRGLGELPGELGVSMITAAELELGVLRAKDGRTRARRLATLTQVRAAYPLLPIDAITASCFARLTDEALARGHRRRDHDTWIAATAMRHGVPVATQDDDFTAFESVLVLRV